MYTGGRDWISSRGTQVRYNYFHDILGYGWENGRWVSPHFAWGIYLDDNTGGVDVIGNIVARSIRGRLHLHNGRDNLIENNIFIDGRLQQIEYSGWTTAHATGRPPADDDQGLRVGGRASPPGEHAEHADCTPRRPCCPTA